MIYLDHSATTALSEGVKQDIINNLDKFGNPSSIYDIGFESKQIIENARNVIAKCINAEPDEIYFTSGASEANSWALNNEYKGFICENYEHHSILNNDNRLASRKTISYIVKEVRGYWEKDTLRPIISMMLVNNEIGFINNIKSLREKYKDFQFHCDATQAIGNIAVDVKDLGVDTMSFSGHKIHAPKGIGVLYIKRGIELEPLIYGGKQENGLRGGTENILGISAMGYAMFEAQHNLLDKYIHCDELNCYTIQKLRKNNIDFIVNTGGMRTVPNILSISIKGVESEPILTQLSLKGIYISSGSACNSGSLEPSETLKHIGVPDDYINGTLRISFDLSNTKEEIDIFVEELSKIIERMTK